METVYNLAETVNMQEIITKLNTAITQKTQTPLNQIPQIQGPGIYLLRYNGNHPAYQNLNNQPIYIGKAMPQGSRKGTNITNTPALQRRLNEHRKSIQATPTLNPEQFTAQWLLLEPLWIALAEGLLIKKYKPVWNTTLDGFGNHDPGKGRLISTTSKWDTLHPGRPWATKNQPRTETPEQLTQTIKNYLNESSNRST